MAQYSFEDNDDFQSFLVEVSDLVDESDLYTDEAEMTAFIPDYLVDGCEEIRRAARDYNAMDG